MDRRQRRQFLSVMGCVITGGLAGCTGDGGDRSDGDDGSDDTGAESTPPPDCSDAIRILSEFEDFPEGGTYREGEEPTEASLQISFENSADVAVDYSISGTFIEYSSRRRRDAGTVSGELGSGETRSYEFVYTGRPQTVVEIDEYELAIESECA